MLGILQKEQQYQAKENRPKTAKREYSAGFRGYGNSNKNQAASSKKLKGNNSNQKVIDLLNELSIGNVCQKYKESLPPQRMDNRVRIQQSINRLTSTKQIAPKNRSKSFYDQQGQNARQVSVQSVTASERELKKLQNSSKFKNAYHLESEYANKAKRNLVIKQKKHQQQKLKKIYAQTKNCHKSNDFSNALLEFVFCKSKQLQSKDCLFTAETLGNLFKNFLLNSQYPKSMPKRQKQALDFLELQKIGMRSLFLYCFLDIPLLKNLQRDSFCFQELYKQTHLNGIIQPTQLINNRFTVPYDVHLYEIKKNAQRVEQPQQNKQCRANPIPKTLYQAQKIIKKTLLNKTETKPFSFAEKIIQKIKPQQFYHWETNFKANQIPESTYKATNPLYPQLDNQAVIKERAKRLLQTAKYPQSMAYLEKYSEYKQQRNAKIIQGNKQKYVIPHHTVKSKSIPNFNRLHAMDIQKFEQLRQHNRKQLKIVPFNFQQIKPRMNKTVNSQKVKKPRILLNENVKEKQQPIKINATKKFQAYVNFRKKEQQKKQKQTKIRQQEQNQKVKDHEQYLRILKERMKQQLIETKEMNNRTKTNKNIAANMVKINIQQIYQSKPLLMQSNGTKKQQQTAFSSLYEPII